jgi:hypothetical protein
LFQQLKILISNPEGERPLGRPSGSRYENIKINVGSLNVKSHDRTTC